MAPPQDASSAPSPRDNGRRNRALLSLLALFTLMGLAYAGYWYLVGQYSEETNNAYVGGNMVPVTPLVTGTVTAIFADENQKVTEGQPIVRLSDVDAVTALERTKAELAETVREVDQLTQRVAELAATVAVREAELARARTDLERDEALFAQKAITEETLEHSRVTRQLAEAALAASRHDLAATQALAGSTPVPQHPRVRQAASRVRDAFLAVRRNSVVAPVSGYVARRAVQIGQRIVAGTPIMDIIPLNQVWVDANFKERQLDDIRIGQPATLVSDLYGKKVVYHGRVTGIGMGTGSVFSLIPAQNATGNWIKVVQRVPVRIALDAAELAQNPLRLGLSITVRIDTHDRTGPVLAETSSTLPVLSTSAFTTPDAEIAALVTGIIRDNLRNSPPPPASPKPSGTNAGH